MARDWTVERCSAEARGDAPAIGAMLGRAFSENPIARACVDRCTPAQRLARVSRLNVGLTRAALRRGEVEVVRDGPAVVGAQLTYPPGTWPLDLRAWLSMARGAIGTGWRGVERYSIYDQEVHPLHPPGPCVYLWVLGVEPASQGQGIGAALLRALAQRADRARLPVYLETDKDSSVRMYRSHGFEVDREVDLARLDGLHVWTMVRHPH